jgi:hypothetical protein
MSAVFQYPQLVRPVIQQILKAVDWQLLYRCHDMRQERGRVADRHDEPRQAGSQEGNAAVHPGLVGHVTCNSGTLQDLFVGTNILHEIHAEKRKTVNF